MSEPTFFELHNERVKSREALFNTRQWGHKFEIASDYKPAGDQPTAIKQLVQGINDGARDQVLLGVTGSGKTFTMANIIEQTQRPALVLAHNKTLAAQLYSEMKSFFPHNAVEYFVSYYDYFQPEAYVAKTDTYIEKDSSVNERIDRLRHAATRALLERRDVIIVASVSCIYGIGEVETYSSMVAHIKVGDKINPRALADKLIDLQYDRNDIQFLRGYFRIKGDILEIFPAHLDDCAWRISFFGSEIEKIQEFDPLTGELMQKLPAVEIYPNSHYVTAKPTLQRAITTIKKELGTRLEELVKLQKLVEEQRLRERTNFDLEMLIASGMCAGIENYSRHLTGRLPGEPPPCLFEYVPPDALLFVDESHVTVSQIGAMYKGDFSRKSTLSEFGFRLPSCIDNRPLKFEEWEYIRPQTIFVSATPGPWELNRTGGVVAEQLVRPTGLLDPVIEIRPTTHQVDDLMHECQKICPNGHRVLVTTLTKKMAEDLTTYMVDHNLKVRYLHSDIDTLERIEIIRDLRLGVFDILVGINLLREGLDIPECALVAILDADKEGFLRSKTSLIQTIGRAARHVEGRVILYADRMTDSLNYAISETNRRREKQTAYNLQHGITPKTIIKMVADSVGVEFDTSRMTANMVKQDLPEKYAKMTIGQFINLCDKAMLSAAKDLQFERAAALRDEIKKLQTQDYTLPLIASNAKVDILEKQ